METRLVPYETLSLVQKQQLDTLQVHPEQLAYSGDIYCALNSLLVNPSPNAIKGFALLADDVPVAFLLLKRPPCLPHWADEHSATLHALQVDHRAHRDERHHDGREGVDEGRHPGVELSSIEVRRPTLDDVFLDLTGRSLREG